MNSSAPRRKWTQICLRKCAAQGRSRSRGNSAVLQGVRRRPERKQEIKRRQMLTDGQQLRSTRREFRCRKNPAVIRSSPVQLGSRADAPSLSPAFSAKQEASHPWGEGDGQGVRWSRNVGMMRRAFSEKGPVWTHCRPSGSMEGQPGCHPLKSTSSVSARSPVLAHWRQPIM